MTEIKLTEKEVEVLSHYLFRKCARLKESGLEDSVCYNELYSVYNKLRNN